MAEYSIATMEANESIDAFLQAYPSTDDDDDKGLARFFADDGFFHAPTVAALVAVKHYSELIGPLGEMLKIGGCEIYCPAVGAGLVDLPYLAGRVTHTIEGGVDVSRIDGIKVANEAVMICGVAVGTPEYVKGILDRNLEGQRSYIENILTQLQSTHTQSLFSIVHYCLASRLLRHATPLPGRLP